MVTTIDPLIGVKTTKVLLESDLGGIATIKAAPTTDNSLFALPATSGTANQALVTDGLGNLTWSYGGGAALNIAALRATDPSSAASANVLGYYTAGDGGGGEFYSVTGAAAGTYVDNGGTIIVPTGGDGSKAWLRPKSQNLNIREWGAVGNNIVDDTASIKAAIAYAASRLLTVYIPVGDFKVTSTISLPTRVCIVGENRNTSRLIGVGQTFPIIDVIGSFTTVDSICIRGGSVGYQRNNVSGSVIGNSGIVNNCVITLNRIGVLLNYSFIHTVSNNWISFNSYGICCIQQSYQTLIVDNIIDNNLGGLGVLLQGSSGAVISGNTIEGNRRELTPGGSAPGAGLILVGLNQRTDIENNWFEQNGNQPESVDIMISRPEEAWATTVVTTCVPTEYQSLMPIGSGSLFTGLVNISGNFHFASQYGVAVKLTSASNGYLSITNATFVGILNKYNKPVYLYGDGSVKTNISGLSITNTGNTAITPQMTTGIKNTPVYWSAGSGTTTPSYGEVMYEGQDLFTAKMSISQFSALSGATLDVSARSPTSGVSQIYNGKVAAVGGTSGVSVVTGTGRPRVGATAMYPSTGDSYYIAVLSSPSGATSYLYSTGTAQVFARDADGYIRIAKTLPVTSTEGTFYTGDYVGLMVMTESAYASSSIQGCTRLEIIDLEFVSGNVESSTIPTSFTGATNWQWLQSDIVYNNSPTSGGFIGWVCVSSGAPGTWTTFGPIT